MLPIIDKDVGVAVIKTLSKARLPAVATLAEPPFLPNVEARFILHVPLVNTNL